MTMLRLVPILGVLDGVYLGILGSVDPADALIGLGVAGLLVWWFHDHVLPKAHDTSLQLLRRLAWLPPFVVVVVGRALRGAATIGWGILRRDGFGASAIVEVPIAPRSDVGVCITGIVESLSPGSVLVDVDERRSVMLFHYADARDPDRIREGLARFYERWQRRVFP